MAGELFGSESPEISSFIFVDDDLIVGGLPREVLSRGMHGCGSYGVHLRF